MTFEVTEPILCSPYREPDRHWFIPEGGTPVVRPERRRSFVFQARDGELTWDLRDGTLAPMTEYGSAYELVLVNRIRDAVAAWRASGYQNATGTTRDLIAHWRRDGREQPLFYAQLEAAETVIFLTEGPYHELQGIEVPRDEPTPEQRAAGAAAFTRHACKMATGSGKTTVMGMLSAWSILNKVVNRADARFSDLVLAVCPNVTIRDRLQELDVERGDASIYRTRDLVPAALMPRLAQGRVVVTNWHVFEPRTQGVGDVRSGVLKVGQPVTRTERVFIGDKNTTARGDRYVTENEYLRLVASGEMEEVEPPREGDERLSAVVRWTRYVESDNSIVQRVLGRSRGKQNILVLNDEAHHAYRIHRDEHDDEAFGDEDLEEEFVREATVWIEGLDRVHRLRGINRCIDLSATPFFLGSAGRDTGRPFPWTVSDFGLVDAIESGLVKIPQLAVRDAAGGERPTYHNLWRWVMGNLTAAERGGRRANPKPEAVLKWAHIPLATVIGDWEKTRLEWAGTDETRPPVLIVVCKDTKLANATYKWIAEGWSSYDVPVLGMESLRNIDGEAQTTIVVHSKVLAETDAGTEGGGSKADDARWMRFTLDTVGLRRWPRDSQGRDVYPADFEEIAHRRAGRMEVDVESLLHPPGRDVRCIVSVGMLTEGWDARTVTHVVGLRPFQSQLLCEQVVGRALRRASYDPIDTPEGKRFGEEVAQVLGVPFEIIPFKATGGPPRPPSSRRHVRALPDRAEYAISFPRVEGYTQVVRNRIEVNWDSVPSITLDPTKIPVDVQMSAALPNNQGRVRAIDSGKVREMTMESFFAAKRLQQLIFEAAGTLTKDFIATGSAKAPAHILFPQVQQLIARFVADKVKDEGRDKRVLFCAPYYGWFLERLVQAIRSDASVADVAEALRLEKGRPEGSTHDVDFWTSRPVADIARSHVNYMVSDSNLEAKAAVKLDGSAAVKTWVKNTGLGLAVRLR